MKTRAEIYIGARTKTVARKKNWNQNKDWSLNEDQNKVWM